MLIEAADAIAALRDVILLHALSSWYQDTGLDLRHDPLAMCRLRDAATGAARRLLFQQERRIVLQCPFMATDERGTPLHLRLSFALPDPGTPPDGQATVT